MAGDTTRLTVRQNEDFEVRVASNPTTGYSWQVVSQPNQLHVVDHGFAGAPAGAQAAGAAGEQVFHLRATQSGTYTFDLELKRPWEGNAIAQRRFEIEVTP